MASRFLLAPPAWRPPGYQGVLVTSLAPPGARGEPGTPVTVVSLAALIPRWLTRRYRILPTGAPIPAVEPTSGGHRHRRAPSPGLLDPGWQLIGWRSQWARPPGPSDRVRQRFARCGAAAACGCTSRVGPAGRAADPVPPRLVPEPSRWAEQYHSALAQEFRLVASDLRGHGMLEAPPEPGALHQRPAVGVATTLGEAASGR